MLPNFLIIGTARAATDTLYYTLKKHPEICMAKSREVHYFDRNFYKGTKWYEKYFVNCEKKIVGEKTANYLFDTSAPKNIFNTLGEKTKLICVLRNPSERAYSHYTNWIKLGVISKEKSFLDTTKQFPDILEMGKYKNLLDNYLKYFAKNNIKIILFDDIKNKPKDCFAEIFTFLDIRIIDVENRKRNASKEFHRMFGKNFNDNIINKFERILPSTLYRNFVKITKVKSKKLKKEDKEYLDNYFHPENEKLFNFLNKTNIWT
ncbi:hypothetical protein C0584_01790 [Candidatus Parcubacteria bacterium]|nr:MAG: hypothetical protein C0584_01790 [Candidatus Parcubacteria bacterium]